MRAEPYSSLSIDDLLRQFERSCLIQYGTYTTDDLDTYSRELKKLARIKNDLQSHGPIARRALLQLFGSPNKQVRFMAAQHAYPVAKGESKACLQSIADGPFSDPQVFAAKLCLQRLSEAPDGLDH